MLLGIQNYPSNASILLWQTRFCQAETGLLGMAPSTKWIASEWPVQEKVPPHCSASYLLPPINTIENP